MLVLPKGPGTWRHAHVAGQGAFFLGCEKQTHMDSKRVCMGVRTDGPLADSSPGVELAAHHQGTSCSRQRQGQMDVDCATPDSCWRNQHTTEKSKASPEPSSRTQDCKLPSWPGRGVRSPGKRHAPCLASRGSNPGPAQEGKESTSAPQASSDSTLGGEVGQRGCTRDLRGADQRLGARRLPGHE